MVEIPFKLKSSANRNENEENKHELKQNQK
jgi:hypothetical protein